MKVVQINTVCGKGSTGKIAISLSNLMDKFGIENYVLYAYGGTSDAHGICYSRELETKVQALKSRILGNYGFNSRIMTQRLISILDSISPDIVHIHNIHGHNANINILFRYFKEKKIKVIWTLHDCWLITGYCVHFTMAKCDKWQFGCGNCPQKASYSWFFDRSAFLQRQKKLAVLGCNLTLVSPSKWLKKIVSNSKFSEFPFEVFPNGIDLSVFYPKKTDIRERLGIDAEKKMVLGVASGWDKKKGLDTFIELSERLDDSFQIVLVGTNEKIDRILPRKILSIHRTSNQVELAEIYSAADVFFNPTREDTFPTVNMEAVACGTPVLTFNVCGSPEIITDKNGVVLENRNIDEIVEAVVHACEYFSKNPINSNIFELYDYEKNLEKYINLYFSVYKGGD